MKSNLLAAGAVSFMFAAAAFAQTAEDAIGVWESEVKSQNEFYKCGDGLCGKILRVVDGQKTDDKNPDPAKKNRPIVGLVFMQGLKRTGPNTWSGNLYNRGDGKTYSGTLTVKSKDRIEVAGCVAAVFCSTTSFKRVK
jgi:uncharacterized protein (DUF2147 family)